ncbi:MAG: sigma-70 region 4 domain-containing protein [Lachnospiraceae bacterium]|nr:sigma-70 region 4 domain-containing protein [Lachnospiraceae bacterium]
MKNYKESDYALNKYSQGIVYKFVDGALEVTLKDYLRDNPDKTAEDFAELKALSDEIYHEQVVLEHRTCRKNISIDLVPEAELAIEPEFNGEQMEQQEENERALRAIYKLLHSGMLTEVQRRRFLLHYFQGLSIRQIAEMERVHQRAVWDSLMWAGKKLKKIF